MEKEAQKGKIDKKEAPKRHSKFSNKYSERIESIKQADEMIKLKEQKIKKDARRAARAKAKKEGSISSKAKTQKIKKKRTPQEIREEMLKKLDDN